MPQPRILITGASSGIGKATALLLAKESQRLFLTGRNKSRLQRVAQSCEKKGAKVSTFLCEMENLEEVEALADAVLAETKRLDGLVNNAAAYAPQPFMEMSADSLERHLRANVVAPTRLTQRLANALGESSNASVVNVSSTLGWGPVPNQAAYSASKAALHSITHSMALELAPLGIRANAVLPGVVDTPIHDRTFDAKTKQQVFMQIGGSLPAGRIGKPADIAPMIAHLLSPQSKWTTGSLIAVDGGINVLKG